MTDTDRLATFEEFVATRFTDGVLYHGKHDPNGPHAYAEEARRG